jgi:glucose/mannose-6-phosphate isomerase
MLDVIRNYPTICKDTLKTKIAIPEDYKTVKNIIITGMGGSAISGDVLKDWLLNILKIPIDVSRSYELPAYANENTLLICISYSGNTIETLSQLDYGIKKRCKIFGITSGGKVESILRQLNFPLTKVKSGMLPRVAFPYLLFSAINLIKSLGWVEENISLDVLEKEKSNIEKAAQDLAKKIKGTFPIIYGTYPSVCRRFKTQLDENSKTISKYEILPELNHNEIQTWRNLNKKFSIVLLREKNERFEIEKSIEFLKSIIKKKTNCYEIIAKGNTKLERMLYLIMFGDFVSYYLAKANKVDPSENKYIDELKKRIASKK